MADSPASAATGIRPATRSLAPGWLVAVARFGRPFLPVIGGVLLFSWGMVFVAWLLLPQARTVEVVIPPGTADLVARGESVEALPRTLLLRRGDTLVLLNQDDQPHRIGAVWAEPGRATRTIVGASLQDAGAVACSFHPGGSIGVSPQARPGVEQTLFPTALLFFPLTGATVLTLSITRRLSHA